MIIKLQDLTDIKTGITFRNRLLDNLDGGVEVIQMKDIDEQGNLSERLVHINEEFVKPKHLLQSGHIILLAKGKYTSASLIASADRKLVVSSAFFSIKVKAHTSVLPAYLQWFLNQPEATSYFKSYATGTSMFSLPMSVLKKLEVPVPPLPVQEKVVQTINLRRQESETARQLEAEREKYLRQLLIHHVYQK